MMCISGRSARSNQIFCTKYFQKTPPQKELFRLLLKIGSRIRSALETSCVQICLYVYISQGWEVRAHDSSRKNLLKIQFSHQRKSNKIFLSLIPPSPPAPRLLVRHLRACPEKKNRLVAHESQMTPQLLITTGLVVLPLSLPT